MTPYQGDSPNEPRGRQPSGSEYQQPPTRQPQQPPGGQYQGQPTQQGGPAPQGQTGQQPQPGRSQSAPQYQGSVPQGQAAQAPPQQQPGMQAGTSQGMQTQPGGMQGQVGGMQSPQATPPGQQTSSFGQQPGLQPQRGGGPQLRPITVEEIIQDDVATAQRDTPIATVVASMAEEDVGSVVVVENDQPTGILTDRKIALALENTPDIANKQAGDLVGGDLVTGTTDMSVFDALDQLSDEEIRRLPIVDDDGTLEGIVTLDDILVLLGSELNKVGEIIQAQSPRL